MANEEHFAILKPGVEAWNKWREEHLLILPKLSGADLRGANLTGANVEGAILWSTTFGDVDLSAVKGLDKVTHQGPSTVGIDTIYKSKGKIPSLFERVRCP